MVTLIWVDKKSPIDFQENDYKVHMHYKIWKFDNNMYLYVSNIFLYIILLDYNPVSLPVYSKTSGS